MKGTEIREGGWRDLNKEETSNNLFMYYPLKYMLESLPIHWII